MSLLRRTGRALLAFAEDIVLEPLPKDEKPAEDDDPAAKAKADEEEDEATPRLGASGQQYSGGQWLDEYHEDLRDNQERVKRLNEMRIGDSVVAGQLLRVETPLLQATWEFEPPDDPELLPSESAAKAKQEAEAKAEGGDPLAPGKPGKGVEPDGKTPATKAPAKPAGKVAPAPTLLADPPLPLPDPGEDVEDEGDGELPSPEEAEAQEAADLAKQDADAKLVNLLTANVLGKGDRAYRMRTTWMQWLREALTARTFGVSWFERTYRQATGRWGSYYVVDALYWMHPSSIRYVHIDRNGELIGITQHAQIEWYDPPTDAKATPAVHSEWVNLFIPTEQLVCIVRRKEGSSFEGIADVRHMYADAKHSAFLRKAQRIDAANRAVGIPRVEIGDGASPQAKADAVRWVQRMSMGAQERRGVVDTRGIKTGFVDMAANVPDLTDQLRATAFRVALLNGTEFTLLGSEGAGGSYSAGEVLSAYFNLSIQATAEWLRSEFQVQVVEPLVDLNAAGSEAPVLRVSDLTPTSLEEILAAKKEGALTWTDQDEQEARRKLKWRPLTDEELAERAHKKAMGEALAAMSVGADPNAPGGGEGGGKPKPGAAVPPMAQPIVKPPAELSERPRYQSWRPLTEHEARYMPLSEMATRWETLQREFAQLVTPLRFAAIDEALSKARIDGTKVTVPRLKRAPLEKAIRAFALSVREWGRETARQEIGQQVRELVGVELDELKPFNPLTGQTRRPRAIMGTTAVVDAITEELETVVRLDVDEILDAITKGVQREMLKQLAAEAENATAIEAAALALKDRSEAPLEKMGREITSRAVNGGRADVTEQAREELGTLGLEVEMVVRTEVMDEATCGPCEDRDGMEVELGSDDYFEHMPPEGCLGGAYCRGVYELVVTRR